MSCSFLLENATCSRAYVLLRFASVGVSASFTSASCVSAPHAVLACSPPLSHSDDASRGYRNCCVHEYYDGLVRGYTCGAVLALRRRGDSVRRETDANVRRICPRFRPFWTQCSAPVVFRQRRGSSSRVLGGSYVVTMATPLECCLARYCDCNLCSAGVVRRTCTFAAPFYRLCLARASLSGILAVQGK